MPNPTPSLYEKRHSRRQFIKYCGISAAAVAVYSTLPSIFTGCSTDSFSQEKFIQLSAFLTGFDENSGVLDPKYAQLYQESLKAFPPSKTTLQELYDKLGVGTTGPVNVELSDDEEKLAQGVILCWYTGNYQTSDGVKSATYEDMLAWNATGYVTPNAQCRGTMGFWADAPQGGMS